MFRTTIVAADIVLTFASVVSHIQNAQQQSSAALKEAGTFEQRITAVAVSKSGRMFVNFPNWSDDHTYSLVEVLPDGSTKPYPTQQWNSWQQGSNVSPSKSFVCVQSVFIDDRDNLWILDPASPKLEGVVRGGPKLVKIDLAKNEVAQVISFSEDIAPPSSYLNDVRVDTKLNWAYITDSGMGAIVAVNLQNGQARRMLEDHASTKAEEGVTLKVNGKELRDPKTGRTPQIHADGIALSKDGEHLYYHALTGKTLYRVPTSVLREESQSGEMAAEAVEKIAQTVPTDGMLIDDAGNVFHTAFEQNAIVKFTPDQKLETVVQSERMSWPDSMAMTTTGGNFLYFTTSQLQHMPKFGGNESERQEPFHVFKVALPAHGGEKPVH